MVLSTPSTTAHETAVSKPQHEYFQIDPALETAISRFQKTLSRDVDYIAATLVDSSDPKGPPTLRLTASGEGGVEELQKHLPKDDVAYGLVRTAFTWESVGTVRADTQKVIFLMYRPDSIPFKHKRLLGVAEGQIKTLFSPFHVTLQAESKDEVCQQQIRTLLEAITMRADKSLNTQACASNQSETSRAVPLTSTGTKSDPRTKQALSQGAEVAFTNPEELHELLAQVRSDENSLTWIIFRYEGKKKLVFHAKGETGVDEMVNAFDDRDVMYGLCRVKEIVDMSTTIKFCFITWQPEGISPMKKCLISTHQGFVHKAFRPYQFDFHISSRSELSQQSVMEHIGGLTGTISHVTERKQESRVTKGPSVSKATSDIGSQLHIVDKSELDAALRDLHDDASSTNWVLTRLEPAGLKFVGAGADGVVALADKLENHGFNYGVVREIEQIDECSTIKFCLIKYQPDTIPPMQRARLGIWSGAITKLFAPLHGTVLVSEVDELTQDKVNAAVSNLRHVQLYH